MIAVVVLIAALAFGGADQYLGSFSAYPWATEVSLLSAPWLVLPFAAGCTQREARRGAVLGLACTATALAGYALMTLSPVENAHLTADSFLAFVRSQRVVAGGIVTGPLFGFWGSRWRTCRAFAGALVTAAAVFLEPLAHRAAPSGTFGLVRIDFRAVWVAEMAAGAAMLAYVAAAGRRPT